jgi:uncharacterized membrane protein
VIVIGVVFLVLAALAAVAAVQTGRNVNVHLDGFGVHATTTALWVFCAGAVAMLLLLIALAAFRRAARKARARRRELKQQRAEDALATENYRAQTRAEVKDEVRAEVKEEAKAEHRAEPLDVRDSSPVPANDIPGDDPGFERRYIPGDEPSA